MTDWFQLLKDLKNIGLSNSQVARMLKIDDSYLNRIKNGEAEPKYSTGTRLIDLHDFLVVRQNFSSSPVTIGYK